MLLYGPPNKPEGTPPDELDIQIDATAPTEDEIDLSTENKNYYCQ
jgi:hypothetical protein